MLNVVLAELAIEKERKFGMEPFARRRFHPVTL
jgi:hypothetical protein